MKRIVPLVVGALVCAAPLAAQPEPLQCAAETHLSRKGDYLNGTTATVDHGVWEWEIGSGNTYSNIQGITADGNFYATRSLVDPQFALGAYDTANLLVGRYNANPTQRPYAQDVDFLLDACAFDPSDYGFEAPLDNSAYCVLGVQYYSRVVGQFPNPYDNVDRHIAPRQSLAGWDVGGHIRAAWRAGFVGYAQAMVDRILERRPDWEHLPLGGYDYTESSWGALVRVILEMHAAGEIGPAAYAEGLVMADALIAAQAPDGSWGEGNYQTTAYVLLGLRADPWNFTLPWQQAIIYGGDFLEATASPAPTCGWGYPQTPPDPPIEYGEENSEVISALAMINTLPFVDGFETGGTSAWSSEVPDVPLAPLAAPVATPRPAALPV
ncbi:MAG: hypothetical protein F9K18_11175, partial [Thermoanaerobaculia bacterium]